MVVFVGAIYGGYFGAALGVMYVAALALVLDETLNRINALKNVLSACVGLVTVVVFAFFAPVHWGAVLAVAPATIVGGYLGARLARRLPARVLKVLIVTFGTVVGLILLWRALPLRCPVRDDSDASGTIQQNHSDRDSDREGQMADDDSALGVIETQVAMLMRLGEATRRSSPRPHRALDRAAYVILRFLQEAGPQNVSAVATRLNLDGSTVTRQISALHRAGLVVRTPIRWTAAAVSWPPARRASRRSTP